MNQSDDQNNSNLRVSGYGSRIKQTLIVVVALAVIVTAIVLAALWANSREPEIGVQPTPRPTQVPQSTATMPPPDTPTTAPTEPVEVKGEDTATPEPTESPPEDTPTPVDETQEQPYADTPTPTSTVSAQESSAEETPKAETVPTPETTEQPTVAPTDTPTPIPPTETPDAEPAVAATNTPKPEPTATPTITPTPLPTATPTITPVPTPEVPIKLEIYARGDLIDQGIDQSGIKILSVVEHTWPDLTLGCGSIMDDNPARPVKGWILLLGNEENTYTFHIASKDQGDAESLDLTQGEPGIVVNCTDAGETEQLTVNLVHDLRLHEARRVILYRGSKDDEQQPIQDIQDGELIQAIVDALNTSIPIGNTETCETAFRLDFYVLRGIQTIRFFCDKDWFRVGGEQDLWGGTQGALPQALLTSVAPFFAKDPLPSIPKEE